MKHFPAAGDTTTDYALLDRVPPLDSAGKVADSEPPSDELHVQKAELLGNGGLVDFAVRELQAAAAVDGGSWGPAETAQLYDETGHYDQAIEVMKHSTPNYFALDIPDLPRKYWEALFPKAYWSDLKRYAAANGLDPVSGGVAHPAGVGIQSQRGFARQCRWPDAVAAEDRQSRGHGK